MCPSAVPDNMIAGDWAKLLALHYFFEFLSFLFPRAKLVATLNVAFGFCAIVSI
jgi:hypothetical protein